MKAVVNLKRMEAFLSYSEDKGVIKNQDYQNKVKQAVKRYLSEQIIKLDGADIIK